MDRTHLQTKRLRLVPQTLEEVRASLERLTPAEKAQLSADWLARLEHAKSVDPRILGFAFVRRDDHVIVGKGGFKGPPGDEGVVEIAYGVVPEQQGKGYATEGAEALTAFAFRSGKVRVVRAHTLPEANASKRVLTKCGFLHIGQVIDPEDGLVWRWEKHNNVQAEPDAPPECGGASSVSYNR
jgi:RimJ/RimL family protein N-acetyltransferase